MGVQLFNREELLGREIDELDLKGAWRTFKAEFAGQARGQGLWAWYRLEVWPTIRRLRLPLALMALALGVGLVIGYQHAPHYRLPVEAMQVNQLADNFSQTVSEVGLYSGSGVAWILFVNVRALLIATALGIFSFGVLAVVVLMAPLTLTGYFAGQMSYLGINPVAFFAAFILPHGVFEIPAAVLAGAAILRLGASVIAPPPNATLGQGWLRALADWAKIAVAVVGPLLIVGAVVEVFVTPVAVQAVLAMVGG
jgi:stage II sporulation protein M